MSTTSSRTSSRGYPPRPSTPDQTGRTLERSGSYAVAPKSEYLRNALQARRAHHTPTSSLQNTQPPPPPASKPAEIKTPRRSPDVFAEFALSEEQQTPVSPIRRRRTSDVTMGIPRSKTTRELQNELDKLKEKLMTSSLRVELLRSSNKELQQNLASAKEQIERLEPLEDENYDLRAENQQLKLKVENMDDEIARLKDSNEDHRKTNEELTAIASESAAHWEAHEFAIEEAAECIIKMEEEKAVLTRELQELKDRVIALESTSSGSALVDGPAKYPSRVYSVDESRPSTSHFDSDYYSQPSSPQAKPSIESVTSFTPSELSKKFLNLKEERRRSTRDLVNRMSAVSLRALREASPSPAPEVPQIPEAYQQPIPKFVQNDRSETPRANPVQYRKDLEMLPPPLMEAAPIASPVRPHTVAPQAPAPQPDGLRGLYRPERRSSNRASNDVRPSSMVVTSTNSGSLGYRHHYAEPSAHSLSRSSSNHTGTNSSNERLRTLRHRKSSASMRTPTSAASSEWEILASNNSPPVSVSSQADLTTEVDPLADKDRWWRSIDHLTLSQVNAQAHQHLYSGQLSNTPPDIDQPRKLNPITSRDSMKNSPQRSKTATPSNTRVTYEKDFLFNAAESEEDFMRKARNAMPKRKP
ncbi:MAD multi-domain protein [Pyrenophora tritici-repentis]|uniref:MAD multi-domain protein n=1 Tax=Pyrenophora tritici-repentis TaxID=45151 RepID=A0A317AJG3_9PLEO|nr:MAD multi-domain protein [Pyrenophora tritici-repentis]